MVKLTESDSKPGERFGQHVAISGYTAIVGLAGDQGGSVFVYDWVSSWTKVQKLKASDASVAISFGNATAIQGNDALIGAPLTPVPGIDGAGAAYFFSRVS